MEWFAASVFATESLNVLCHCCWCRMPMPKPEAADLFWRQRAKISISLLLHLPRTCSWATYLSPVSAMMLPGSCCCWWTTVYFDRWVTETRTTLLCLWFSLSNYVRMSSAVGESYPTIYRIFRVNKKYYQASIPPYLGTSIFIKRPRAVISL